MTTALLVAGHHVRRLLRNPILVLLLLVIPVTLALIEYAAFGGTVASGRLPPIKVLLLDEDQSLLSRAVPQLFSMGPMQGQFEVETVADRRVARDRFRRNEASALVVVPKGLQSRALAGTRAELEIYKNPIQSILPEIVDGVLEIGAMIGGELLGQLRGPITRIRALIDGGREASDQDLMEIARGFAAAGRRVGGLATLDRAKVTIERPGVRPATAGGVDAAQFFATVFPGLASFALLFIGQALCARLLRDRLRGLQRRVAVTPASHTAVVWGGILYVTASLFAMLIVLAVVARAAFGIRLTHPFALVLIGASLAAFAGGLHLAVVSIARSDRTAAFIGTATVLVLALLGGSFVPIENYPAFLRGLATIVPNGAAQQALVKVLTRGRGVADVAGLILTTAAWSAVLVGVASVLERRRLRVS